MSEFGYAGEKRYFGGWWMWILLLCVVSAIVWFGLRAAGMVGGKVIERAVLVNSHQYIEGMAQRGATLRANIAEAEAMLVTIDDAETRQNINAQLAGLRAQLSAITRIEK